MNIEDGTKATIEPGRRLAGFRDRLSMGMITFAILCALLQSCGGGGSSGGVIAIGEETQPSYYEQLWNIAREVLRDDMTEAEIAEALARWVVDSSTNALWVPEDSLYPLPEDARSEEGLLPFHGLCGSRSQLFQYLGQRAGLTVSMFNIYNFGSPGAGHSCVQVYYDGGWHFYDVTYAGMFVSGGRVLSFAEMRADPALAIANMVVFEPAGTIRDYYSSGLPVDNNVRMHYVYTEQALTNAISTSFLGSGNLVPLEVLFDLSLVPIHIGSASGTSVELNAAGENYTDSMDSMLGYLWDNFEPIIKLTNAIAGQEYILRFHVVYSSDAGLTYRVTSINDVEIVSGEEFTTPNDIGNFVWEIVFKPQAATASFTIHHDCEEWEGLLLNYVTLEVN